MIFTLLLGTIASLALLVRGTGIVNFMLVSVTADVAADGSSAFEGNVDGCGRDTFENSLPCGLLRRCQGLLVRIEGVTFGKGKGRDMAKRSRDTTR